MPSKIENEADREKKRLYDRLWYRRHAPEVNARNKAQRENLQEWYQKLKSNLACQQCGENHPATLVFHHRDPTKKELTIALAVRAGWSISRILKEIEKCDVLCTNCHMRLHANQWCDAN